MHCHTQHLELVLKHSSSPRISTIRRESHSLTVMEIIVASQLLMDRLFASCYSQESFRHLGHLQYHRCECLLSTSPSPGTIDVCLPLCIFGWLLESKEPSEVCRYMQTNWDLLLFDDLPRQSHSGDLIPIFKYFHHDRISMLIVSGSYFLKTGIIFWIAINTNIGIFALMDIQTERCVCVWEREIWGNVCPTLVYIYFFSLLSEFLYLSRCFCALCRV